MRLNPNLLSFAVTALTAVCSATSVLAQTINAGPADASTTPVIVQTPILNGQVGATPQAPATPSPVVNTDLCPGTDQPVNFVSTDANLRTDCRHLECRGMQQQNFTIDGQPVPRYPMVDTGQMSCLKNRPHTPWKVTKTKWDDSDQADWQAFVHAIGMAVEAKHCNTVDGCLVSNANPYRDQTDFDSLHYSDCAKYPEYMRQYFSYKKNLPFSFVKSVRPSYSGEEQPDANGVIKDIRYTTLGNFSTRRENYAGGSAEYNDLAEDLLWEVATKTYRMFSDPQTEFSLLLPQHDAYDAYPAPPQFDPTTGKLIPPAAPKADNLMLAAGGQIPWVQPDFYSPRIDPQSVKIGDVVYNPSGHVALIYDIRAQGRVMLLAAHPGNGVDVSSFDGTTFIRSRPMHGAGFKNWRPFEVVNPVAGKGRHAGEIVGGTFQFAPDASIPDASYEQYFGFGWSPLAWDGAHSVMAPADRRQDQGASLEWDRFVKIRMSNGTYQDDPVAELGQSLAGICSLLQTRADYVTTTMQPGPGGPIYMQPHPANLPQNIYGADGDWESYSSPGKDFGTRHDVIVEIAKLQGYAREIIRNQVNFVYHGSDLQADLLKVFNDADANCSITYTNSQNQPVVIPTLHDALARYAYMSYDPYDCPERRWGAQSDAELATCSNDATKNAWYHAQQWLRNQAETSETKDDNAVMAWDLPTLQALAANHENHAHPTKYDILSVIKAMKPGYVGVAGDSGPPTATLQAASYLSATPVTEVVPALPGMPTPVQPAAPVPGAVLPVPAPAVTPAAPAPAASMPVSAAPVAQAPVVLTPRPAPVTAPVVRAPAPAPTPAPAPVAAAPKPVVVAPVAQAPQCLSGICVGNSISDSMMSMIHGTVVAVHPDTGQLEVKWVTMPYNTMRAPNTVTKL